MRTPLQKLRTFMVVTLMTVLIWLYAEGAIVKTHARQRVRIDFVSPGDATLAIEPGSLTAFVTFRGNSSQLQAFERLTESKPVAIEVEPDGEPRRRINIAQRLETAVFEQIGVDLQAIQPEEVVDLTVRRLEQVELPIVVRADGYDFATAPTPDPATATLILPSDLVPRAEQLTVEMRSVLRERPGRPGTQEIRSVGLELPRELRDPYARLVTAEADINFTLADINEEAVLPSVPLYLEVPPGFGFRVRVDGDAKTLNDVTVAGPRALLQRVLRGEAPVYGTVRLHDATRLAPGRRTEPVFFDTPPGLEVPRLRSVTLVLETPEPEANPNTSGGLGSGSGSGGVLDRGSLGRGVGGGVEATQDLDGAAELSPLLPAAVELEGFAPLDPDPDPAPDPEPLPEAGDSTEVGAAPDPASAPDPEAGSELGGDRPGRGDEPEDPSTEPDNPPR